VSKTPLIRQKSQQAHYHYRFATKLAKAYQYLLLQFQQNIDKEKKTALKENFDLMIHFVLMINLDLF